MRNGIKKLTKARTGSTQGRLDGFFKVLSSPSNATKRKVMYTGMPMREIFEPENCECFLIHRFKHELWVLKRTVSLF